MKIVFAGTPEIAASALEQISRVHEVVLAITRPDAPVGRKRVLTASPVAIKADELGISVLKVNKIDSDFITTLSQTGAQKAVVIAFGVMVPEDALKVMEWWNIHFSLLPKWRGASPLQTSMMNGSESGVSIFRLDQGMDTGPIIASLPIEFSPGETAGQALERFTEVASSLISDLLQDPPPAQTQSGQSSHARKLTRADARIQWDKTADEIDRLVRAMNPEPIAWTKFGDQDLQIIQVQIHASEDVVDRAPGSVFRNFDGQILVQCGSGTALGLVEVKPAGKSRMPSADWFNGQNKEVHFG